MKSLRQESYKEKISCNYVNHTIFKLLCEVICKKKKISLEIKKFKNCISISKLNFD